MSSTRFFDKRVASVALLAALVAALGYGLVRSLGTADAQPAPLPRPQDFAATAVTRTTSEQAAALADGTVTLEEYEGAIQQTAQCAKLSGVDVQVEPGKGMRPSSLGFTAEGTLADAESSRQRLEKCKAEYMKAVETTWALQKANASTDEQLAAHALVTACIQDRGVVVEDGFLSIEDLNTLMLKREKMTTADRDLFEAYRACRDTVMEELGYLLP
ncbi:MAG: hypothetical protein HYX53_06740 [Chloroflexi bacterium]|nr:hypothetical protein [Chloroflexota bacterium]